MSREDACQCSASSGYVTNPFLCKGCGKPRRHGSNRGDILRSATWSPDDLARANEISEGYRSTIVEPTRAEAPQGETVMGRFAPTEPKSQWCRNCGLHISRHREQVMHAALCPVDTNVAAQPETVDGGRVREIVEKWCSVTWERSMGRRGAVEAIAREAYAAGRESVRTRIAERIEDMEAARRGGGR